MPATIAAAKSEEKLRGSNVGGDAPASWPGVRNRAGELSRVLSGKLSLMGANAVLMLFLAQRLDLQTYGILVITISGQLLISRFLMMGIDAGMIRLRGLPELRGRSTEIVMAGLVVMAGSTLILLLLCLVSTPALIWLGVPIWIPAFIIVGAVGTSLVDYGYSFRLARHEYTLSAVAQGGTAVFRLALTTLTAILLPAQTILVFAAYHGASLLSGLFQTVLLSNGRRIWPERSLIRRLLSYSRWVGKANIVFIFSLYQGTFLLMLWDSPAATGIFGLALTLSLGFFAIFNAFFEYLLARITSVDSPAGLRRFIRQAFAASVLLSLGCIPVAFIVTLVIPRVLRTELSEVIPVFWYLAASMVFLILQAPFEAACHYLMRPQLVSFNWLMRAVFIAAAGVLMVPSMGALGAAMAQLAGSALAAGVLTILVMGRLRLAEASEHSLRAGPSAVEASDGNTI